MSNRTVKIQILACIAAACFLTPVLLHSCPPVHEDACGSDNHCLICSVINNTVLNPDPSDGIEVQFVSRLPVLIKPILNEELPYERSLPARAPPPAGLS
jgi:hypothetical protein